MQLQDKVALVTGGARGIGEGICLLFAERGANVAVTDFIVDGAHRVAEEVSALGRKAATYKADVTKRSKIEETVEAVINEFGQIDILVNAAGVIAAEGWEDMTRGGPTREEDWNITFNVNVKGTVMACEAIAPHMKEKHSGKIINIASQAGRLGHGADPGQEAYAVSKASVIHFTQTFAHKMGPHNVTVNVLCPGMIWTPMMARIFERAKRRSSSEKDLTPRQMYDEKVKQVIPLRRGQTPRDIAKAAAFFASDDASEITGASLNVNGGQMMD